MSDQGGKRVSTSEQEVEELLLGPGKTSLASERSSASVKNTALDERCLRMCYFASAVM